jgi:hypothetical protein
MGSIWLLLLAVLGSFLGGGATGGLGGILQSLLSVFKPAA